MEQSLQTTRENQVITAHVVTFHKCGSNWFRRLFRDAAETHGANIRVTKPSEADQINQPVERVANRTLVLHRTVTSDEVLAEAGPDDPIFLCLRDPKDVLISQYFSWKKTHANNSPVILEARKRLNEMSRKLGQRFLVHKNLLPYCKAVETWLPQIAAGRVHLLKYEDMLTDFKAVMGPALDVAGLPLDAGALTRLEKKYSFSAVTSRKPGTEDTSNHYRKGVAGDWRNHFDGRLSELFDARYGALCEALRYDRSDLSSSGRARKSSQIVVLGFPKCGTSALVRALQSGNRIDLLRAPDGGLEIPWPQIRDLAPKPKPARILAHKFTAYIYNDEALKYLHDSAPDTHFALCVRDPLKALVSWHNMHRRIATEGTAKNHFAWKERDFYANCSIEEYYIRFAQPRLRYDKYLLNLLKIIPAERVFVLSQESMARNMDNIVAALKDATRGEIHPVTPAPEDEMVYESFADRAEIPIPSRIKAELAGVRQRLDDIVRQKGLQNSL